MARALLLTASALLCLALGADALRCRLCSSLYPGAPCLPHQMSCKAPFPKEACISITMSYGGQVQQKMLGCTQGDNEKCGLTWNDPESGRRTEYTCCSGKDYCNY